MNERILFLCPHGAAKSVIAAAYYQHLAAAHVIHLHVTSAGTQPDAEIAPAVVELLHTEGMDVTGLGWPRRADRHDPPRAGR
jgi:protein-tyrosine-phosphatase